jgi:hypothetical protein
MKKSIYCKFIEDMCNIFNMNLSMDEEITQISQKIDHEIPSKKKKIVKIPHPEEPKRGRGRPRKNISKIESLASIPTAISISL